MAERDSNGRDERGRRAGARLPDQPGERSGRRAWSSPGPWAHEPTGSALRSRLRLSRSILSRRARAPRRSAVQRELSVISNRRNAGARQEESTRPLARSRSRLRPYSLAESGEARAVSVRPSGSSETCPAIRVVYEAREQARPLVSTYGEPAVSTVALRSVRSRGSTPEPAQVGPIDQREPSMQRVQMCLRALPSDAFGEVPAAAQATWSCVRGSGRIRSRDQDWKWRCPMCSCRTFGMVGIAPPASTTSSCRPR